MNKTPILRAQCVSRSYPMGASRLEVLKGVDLEIQAGEDLCIVGSSGAGKSTLLHILGTLDSPTLGKVFYRDQELTKLGPEELAKFRNEKLGFVFQFHHLLSEFSALENVMMPLRIAGAPTAESRHQAMEILETLGLGQRWNHYPSELSGGEQQRVAIARALIRRPEILLADEPTGNLDTQNGEVIQKLFFELKEKLGLTLVVVTHDREFAKTFATTRVLKDGTWLY